jgi:hypothetical protein
LNICSDRGVEPGYSAAIAGFNSLMRRINSLFVEKVFPVNPPGKYKIPCLQGIELEIGAISTASPATQSAVRSEPRAVPESPVIGEVLRLAKSLRSTSGRKQGSVEKAMLGSKLSDRPGPSNRRNKLPALGRANFAVQKANTRRHRPCDSVDEQRRGPSWSDDDEEQLWRIAPTRSRSVPQQHMTLLCSFCFLPHSEPCSAWFLSNRQAEHCRYLLRHHEVASKFLGHGQILCN